MFKKTGDNFLKDDVVASVKMFHTNKGWMTVTSKGLVMAGAVAGAMVAPTVLNHVKANADSVATASSAVKTPASTAVKALTPAAPQLSAAQQAGLAKVGAKTVATPAAASSQAPATKTSTPAPAAKSSAKAPVATQKAAAPAPAAKASVAAPVASAKKASAPVTSAVKASSSSVAKTSEANSSSVKSADVQAPVASAETAQASQSVKQVANQSVKGEISANANDVAVPANQIANLTASQQQATLNSIKDSTFFSADQKKAMEALVNKNDATEAATPNGLKTSDGSRVITPAGVFNDTVNIPLNANNGIMELDDVGGTTSGSGNNNDWNGTTKWPAGFNKDDNDNGPFPDKIAGLDSVKGPAAHSGIYNTKGQEAWDAPCYVGNQIVYCAQPYGLGPGVGGSSPTVTLTRGIAGDANQQREIAGILFYGYGGIGNKGTGYTQLETHLALAWYVYECDKEISGIRAWEQKNEGVTEAVAEKWLEFGKVKQLIQQANNWDADNAWTFTVYSGHSDTFHPTVTDGTTGAQLLIAAKYLPNTKVTVNTKESRTHAIANNQAGHGSQVDASDSITLDFTNAIKGNTYTVTSKLIDKNTGKTLATATNQVTAEGNQTVTTTAHATINTIGLDYHTFYWETSVSGRHLTGQTDFNKDGSDNNEQFKSSPGPTVTTTATDKTTGNNVTNGTHNMDIGSNEVIDDDVQYSRLNPGEKYVITGVVYDKTTGKPLEVNGKEITGQASITAPSTGNGDVHIKFQIPDDIAQQGHDLVVEETIHDLTATGQVVVTDTNINNRGETVTPIPVQIHTTLTDQTDEQNKGSHTLEVGDGIKLIDTVSYTNLQPGQQYVMTGTLMDKETGKPVMVNGQKVTQSVAFTPTSPDGIVKIDFMLPNDIALQGHDLVAFEDLTQQTGSGIKVVATHDNLYDQAETVHVPTPDVHTLATNGHGDHNVVAGPNSVVVDSVQYHNLIPGQKYTISGTLYDKNTGKIVVGDNGQPVTSSVTFIPTTPNGTVNITFHFDGTKHAGHQLVAEEKLYDEHGRLIASYDDINDLAETVNMVKPTPKPQQGSVSPIHPASPARSVVQQGHPAKPVQQLFVQKGQGLPDTGDAALAGLAVLAGLVAGGAVIGMKKKFA